MSPRPRHRTGFVGVAVVTAALLWAATTGLACGFHDDVTLARGVMNWIYPDSLHVVGAVSTAVAERRLPPLDVRDGPDPFGARYRRTVTTLERFGGALGASSSSFSLVLLGPMLWTRFAGDDGGLRALVHVPGPTPGDLVLVSELIVIQAIADGRLAVGEAHREGLIRLYGSDEQRTGFLTLIWDDCRHHPHHWRKPMIGTPLHRLSLGALLGMGLALPALAQDAGTLDQETAAQGFRKPAYSPPAGRNFPVRPFFGDTHVHTSFSMDAGAFGARLTPQDAYRFAKGHEITASSGQRAKLSRPLDFLVVSDHSDNMGFFPQLFAGKPEMLADQTGRRWYDMIQTGKGANAALEIIGSFSQGTFPKALSSLPGTPAYRSAWQETIKAAEEANDPGRFTAFIGYEWTSNTGGNNLHRNVIFRDGAMRASLVEPFTTQRPLGSDNPRDLWKWMQAYEEKSGGDVLAIAHNGNLSNGRMFPTIEPGHRQARGPRIRRDPCAMGAPLRGDADQGRRRGPPVPLAQRRVRQLRALGQGQSGPERTQDARDAGTRIRPLRP